MSRALKHARRLRCVDCGRHVQQGPLVLSRRGKGFVWMCEDGEACARRQAEGRQLRLRLAIARTG